ncbi:Glutamate--tRNA ligase mitochondrial [Elasticomyces elasticus]|nr:Glutamate--tRNA ligase mitochondrial [Elasticomyces elasticus]KAK3654710.1 Glutamate--tRNA ligase mitochondrial [Elasticomyces elasticus]KAK4910301.1 Glutamate--tRNA ligase mitochondrial [Elasticomyces elasticus]KAK5750042.1 Glutamate--tRNA ligase mitochondrial [Elasticomyces elasticus]
MSLTGSSKALLRAVERNAWVCRDCRDCLRRSRVLAKPAAPRNAYSTSIVRSNTGAAQHAFSRLTTISRTFATTRRRLDSSRRAPKLPDKAARTRFAPSPTGYLHIGGLRTALFSYLLAKRTGGQFILRIEDTDQKRLVADAEKRLYEDLQWAGLQWDEGPQVGGPHGPYKQSERTAIYQKHADELLEKGAAYRCFCTAQQSEQARVVYSTSSCYQDCASLPVEQSVERSEDKNEPFTVRLKHDTKAKKQDYPDLVYGKIVPLKRGAAAEPSDDSDSIVDATDTILIKSDGTPTYHFANVVDDHLMQITHVIRGAEWMASSPLHYDLYRAFGWTPPEFAHVGLLVDQNKAKLSKRNADLALDVQSMREEHGVLPETLVNYLALLGWSNPLQNDVLTLDGLVENFDLKFTKGNTMVRMEKLWYLQKQHVARLCEQVKRTGNKEPLALVAAQMSWAILARWPEILEDERFPSGIALLYYCVDILLADSKSYQTPKQYVDRNRYFIEFDAVHVPATPEKYGCTVDGQDVVVGGEDVKMAVEEMMGKDFRQHVPGISNGGATQSDGASAIIHAGIQQQMARTVAAEVNSLDGNEAEQSIHRRQKAWNTAIMRYLREKLSYGLPGPSIGDLMALLGYKECCKRLGVEAKGGGGW